MFGIQFNAGSSRGALRDAMQLLGDMTPVYDAIGDYLVEAHRKRFIEGKSPDGKVWAPKKQSTLDRYKRMGYGSRTRPLIGPGQALSRQIVKLVSRDGVVVGSNMIYSRVMQEGAQKGEFGSDSRGRPLPWGNIPARVWLGLSAENDRTIVEIVDEHLAEKLKPNA